MSDVPEIRVRQGNQAPVRAAGDHVLYWMIGARRTRWNFALDHAISWAHRLAKPLIVLEALRCDYPWASLRHHRFLIDGMIDNQRRFASSPIRYFPYVEPRPGDGKGLVESFAHSAAVVVTDWYPEFFLPRMVSAVGRRVSVRLEMVDSNGVLPLQAADRVFHRAFDLRRFLQRHLPDHLGVTAESDPLVGLELPCPAETPARVEGRWSETSLDELSVGSRLEAAIAVDPAVAPVAIRGGESAAHQRLLDFIERDLGRYAEKRRAPGRGETSRLSSYLHFGHIAAQEVVFEVLRSQDWNPSRLGEHATGARSGWWGTSEPVEQFLDQIVTWRELGFNMSWQRSDAGEFSALPDWAQTTLALHESDPREPIYDLREFEDARTHDPIWNAAQRQLLLEGRIHNYLRMLWGKKILEWSMTPRRALEIMLELNNKYALDGRDPNSLSGIFWCLGRYDRAWGPERPIFGKIRYMSSENTARKLDLAPYLERFGAESQQRLDLD